MTGFSQDKAHNKTVNYVTVYLFLVKVGDYGLCNVLQL